MIEILGIKLTYETIVFFALFLASEAVGLSRFKSNTVVQLILTVVNALRPHRTEDDQIKKIRETLGQ